MQQFARGIGFMSVGVGVLLLAFPRVARRMIEVRAEFARLSPSALRLLGVWELMMGALLVSSTARPAAEVSMGEEATSRLRRAA
jgi:uncharacterized protein YjeT (DUF2065 family)